MTHNMTTANTSYFKDGEIERYNKEFDAYCNSSFYRKVCESRSLFNRLRQTSGILFKNPFILSHVVRDIKNKYLHNKTPLRSLEIAVEYNCNSACEQCSCRLDYRPGQPRLSMAEFKSAVDQAIELGAFQFCITGGEPLLQFNDVCELVAYIRSKKCYVHLCSNGLLITRDILEKLAKLGLNSLEMGLDSVEPDTHDDNRREGGFQKIMQNTEWAKELNMLVIWNTVCTSKKIDNNDLLALIKLARKKGALLQITPPCVTGAWRNKEEILLNERGQKYFWWLMSFANVRTDMYSSLTSVRCPAAREKIGLQPYGDVVSCPLIQIKYGNVKNESLASIRNKMLEDNFYLKKSYCMPAFDRPFIEKHLLDK